MTKSTLWGIHAGKTGDAHTIFYSQNVVALGWTAMDDLSKLLPNREAFKETFAVKHPEAKKGAIPVNAGQMYRFVYEMKIGDLVAYPSKTDHMIHIANIIGDYFYDSDYRRSYPHQRKVNWICKVPRSFFSQEALYEIGSAMSLFQIKTHTSEFFNAMKEVAKTAKIEIIKNKSNIIKPVKRRNKDKVRIYCNTCRNSTNHKLEYSYMPEPLNFLDEEHADTITQSGANLWVCLGCEHVTMEEIALDQDQVELGSEFYPSLEKYHLTPKSYVKLDNRLAQMYTEVISCFNNEAQILCAAGLRALLEAICVDQNIPGGNLKRKINNLSERFPENISQGLHWFRENGNKAVHELNAPSTENLRLGITVIETLLDYFYKLDTLVTRLNAEIGTTNISTEQPGTDIIIIKRVLERNPAIPFGQKDLYRVLYQAGEAGLKYEEIAEQMHNRNTNQLAGVLGALGTRINGTKGVEGKPGVGYLFEIVRGFDDDPTAWGWRMKPEMHQVIKNSNYDWAKDWR